MQSEKRGLAALLLVTAVWGTTFPAMKLLSAQLDALHGPITFELTVSEQRHCDKSGWLTAIQDDLRDIRSQEAQPEDASEV